MACPSDRILDRWLLGYGYQELPGSSDSDWSTEDWSVPGPDRDELQVLALESHEVVLEHGYKLGADGEWKMKEDAVVAKLLYGNNAKAGKCEVMLTGSKPVLITS